MSAASLEGPSFLAFVVDDLDAASSFWIDVVGLKPAPHSPPGAQLFETNSIPFAIRTPRPGEKASNGDGISVWFSFAGDIDAYRELLVQRRAAASDVGNGPFGRMFTLHAPGGFNVTVHAAQP